MSARRVRDLRVFPLTVGGEELVVVSAPAIAGDLDALSPAEREVARDAAAGLSNAAIARRRRRAPRTIANQLASVYRKLGVSSRAELAVRLAGGGRG